MKILSHFLIVEIATKQHMIYTQYAHNVILTSIRRRPNVMDVVKTSKQHCVRCNDVETFYFGHTVYL